MNVVLPYLEIILLQVFISSVRLPLVILKSSLILFLSIVIGKMNTSQDEVRIVLKIRIDVIDFLIINGIDSSLDNILRLRSIILHLMNHILQLLSIHKSLYRFR